MTHTHSIAHHNRRRLMELRAPRLIVAAVAALLAIPGMARAQALGEMLPPPPASPQETVPDGKSPGTALALSVAPTAAGVVMFARGMDNHSGSLAGVGALLVLTGPSFGHFYTGEHGTGLGHIGLRAGAVGAMFVGVLSSLCFLAECEPPDGAKALIWGGAAVGTASAIYSIYDAPRAARRANAKMRARQLILTPAPMAGPDGTGGLGMHLTGQF
jgi:hypothetical protein